MWRKLRNPAMQSAVTPNRFVEWTHNGGQRGRHSSMLSAPSRPIHGRR